MTTRYAIKAIFSNEDGKSAYTYYEERTYATPVTANRAINGGWGDLLVQAATLDCKYDAELKGYWLEDLDVYEIKEEI
jgi:hypothetical protein